MTGLPCPVLRRVAHLHGAGAVAEGAQVVGREPAGGAQLLVGLSRRHIRSLARVKIMPLVSITDIRLDPCRRPWERGSASTAAWSFLLKIAGRWCKATARRWGGGTRNMAQLVFGMNQSLDGYVDHMAFAPSPKLFRHFVEQAREQVGSVYGRRLYEVMRYWDEDHPGWGAEERDFAAAWRSQPKWVVSRSLTSVGPNATLIGNDIEAEIRGIKDRLERRNRSRRTGAGAKSYRARSHRRLPPLRAPGSHRQRQTVLRWPQATPPPSCQRTLRWGRGPLDLRSRLIARPNRAGACRCLGRYSALVIRPSVPGA